MISERRLRNTDLLRAARDLAQLLKVARRQLPAHARVCPGCQHVFSLDRRLDMRCPDCAANAAEREAVRL